MDMRPAVPVAIDTDTTRVHEDPTVPGGRVQAYEHVYTEYDAGRIQAGYCCLNCGEAQAVSVAKRKPCVVCLRAGREVFHEAPFPEHCFCCGFPMRDEQLRQFALEFDGYAAPLGPSRTLEELRAEDVEAKERQRRRLEGKPTSSIWLPS